MKILFVVHEASRTGAPLFMLAFLKWLKKEHNNIKIDVLLGGKGELEPEFHNISKVYYWYSFSSNYFLRALNKLFPGLRTRVLRFVLSRKGYDLCYANSVASSRIMKNIFYSFSCPFLMHVHELESEFSVGGSERSFQECAPFVDRFIAVSDAAKFNLIGNQNIPENKILVLPPVLGGGAESFVPIDLKKALALPENALIVGLCGTLCWRKGIDLLVPLIERISSDNRSADIFFVWVGQFEDMKQKRMIEYDLKKLGLLDKVKLPGKVSNSLGYIAEFDILLLLSREESYSLVAAEASALGKKVVCFEHSIGWTDYAEPSSFVTVPYLKLSTMADVILDLIHDPRTSAGDNFSQVFGESELKYSELFEQIVNCAEEG